MKHAMYVCAFYTYVCSVSLRCVVVHMCVVYACKVYVCSVGMHGFFPRTPRKAFGNKRVLRRLAVASQPMHRIDCMSACLVQDGQQQEDVCEHVWASPFADELHDLHRKSFKHDAIKPQDVHGVLPPFKTFRQVRWHSVRVPMLGLNKALGFLYLSWVLPSGSSSMTSSLARITRGATATSQAGCI